ncbi:MAG: EcsC family protein [Clostridia bacterium]|nr:EcsC family protein [Clostridia bacterium]
MTDRSAAVGRELRRLQQEERRWLAKHQQPREGRLERLLAERVPAGLREKLESAFSKGLMTVLKKGEGWSERMLRRQAVEQAHRRNLRNARVMGSSRSLKAFSGTAGRTGVGNTVLSGFSGAGLGLLGIGLPDIVLFSLLLQKALREIALGYGFDGGSDRDRCFDLLLIQGALSHGAALERVNGLLDRFIRTGNFPREVTLDSCIQGAADALSDRLLEMKFLQSFAVVGVVGGLGDLFCMREVTAFARLKYHRRFLWGEMEKASAR